MPKELGVQAWDADSYAREASYVSQLGQSVFELLDPKPGERILDLGCGEGTLTRKLVESGADVIGLDASETMVMKARESGLTAILGQAQALSFECEFDAVFSNAALHWVKKTEEVVRGVRRSLKDSGRFVAEFGGFGNVAAIVSAIIGVLEGNGYPGRQYHPWYNPSVPAYRDLLEKNQFRVEHIESVWRPTPLPQGMRMWLDLFAQAFFEPTGQDADRLKDAVVEVLEPSLKLEDGTWIADHVRLRFVAIAI